MMVTTKEKTRWPVKLFWSPFGAPSLEFLGVITDSILYKRRRLREGGCLFTIDVNPESPPLPTVKKACSPQSKGVPSSCLRTARNSRLARSSVRLLKEQGLGTERVRPLPRRIRCGHLRSAIRSIYPEDLTPVQELSIKTAQKLELDPCSFCQTDGAVEVWKEERLKPQPINDDHVYEFKRALRLNISRGWNQKKWPYIPNGHASLSHSRAEGGNWVREDFSGEFRTELVYSSGKPRVVTLYSSYNVEVLTPLHRSLYGMLKRRDWLLVGSPTDERVRRLDRGTSGPYVSVDYAAATDNIKTRYVQAAIDVLIEKGKDLTEQEKECMLVIGNMALNGSDSVGSGQPMGSPLSFPLLCLINRTVVDLSLNDLLGLGKISRKEFREHRCLINGDDLLYREFNENLDIYHGILFHGGLIGLKLNREKTMVDWRWAEINSTAFFDAQKKKKTNLAVLEVKDRVTDAIGFIADSVIRRQNFLRLIKLWAQPIAKQERKLQGPIPPAFFSSLWRIRDALETVSTKDQAPNPFPVVVKPVDYRLPRGEAIEIINSRVNKLRDSGYIPTRNAEIKSEVTGRATIQAAIRKLPPSPDTVLRILAVRWEEKKREALVEQDNAELGPTTWVWDENSKIDIILDRIAAFKNKRKEVACATLDPALLGGDYVALA